MGIFDLFKCRVFILFCYSWTLEGIYNCCCSLWPEEWDGKGNSLINKQTHQMQLKNSTDCFSWQWFWGSRKVILNKLKHVTISYKRKLMCLKNSIFVITCKTSYHTHLFHQSRSQNLLLFALESLLAVTEKKLDLPLLFQTEPIRKKTKSRYSASQW